MSAFEQMSKLFTLNPDGGGIRAFELEALGVCDDMSCRQQPQTLSRAQMLSILAGAKDWPVCCGKYVVLSCSQVEMKVGQA